jgi:hypothetical protein
MLDADIGVGLARRLSFIEHPVFEYSLMVSSYLWSCE